MGVDLMVLLGFHCQFVVSLASESRPGCDIANASSRLFLQILFSTARATLVLLWLIT